MVHDDAARLVTSTVAAHAIGDHPEPLFFIDEQRILIDLGHGFFISQQSFAGLCAELQELFSESPERSVAEIRDHWGITRKHAIPLLEFCDKSGITVRNGDVRMQGREMSNQFSPEPAESQS